jgi:hypothetical protein
VWSSGGICKYIFSIPQLLVFFIKPKTYQPPLIYPRQRVPVANGEAGGGRASLDVVEKRTIADTAANSIPIPQRPNAQTSHCTDELPLPIIIKQSRLKLSLHYQVFSLTINVVQCSWKSRGGSDTILAVTLTMENQENSSVCIAYGTVTSLSGCQITHIKLKPQKAVDVIGLNN